VTYLFVVVCRILSTFEAQKEDQKKIIEEHVRDLDYLGSKIAGYQTLCATLEVDLFVAFSSLFLFVVG
jgi:hypothetical protein